MNSQDKQQLLSEVIEEMSQQLTYELAQHANLVPGEGNVDAKVMFIGEAPGADEDRLKRPFVGRSGQLLRANIRNIGWQEEAVYITNVVKHRPPDNRDPFPAEIEANKPFLNRQIDIIDPDLIVTLGRYSMAKFFPDKKISQIRGKVFRIRWYGRTKFVLPLYHPAAALRNPTMKQAFESDFMKLPKILKWIQEQQPTISLEDNVKEFLL